MTKNYYALKNKPKNTARIISENRINYILGFINGDSKSCNKYACQQELYVGDIVKLNITKDNKEQLELIERKISSVKQVILPQKIITSQNLIRY